MNKLGGSMALFSSVFVCSATYIPSQTPEEPRFDVEIRRGEHRPFYTVTNQTSKSITACVVKLSSSSGKEGKA
jgi:hypothetical protein